MDNLFTQSQPGVVFDAIERDLVFSDLATPSLALVMERLLVGDAAALDERYARGDGPERERSKESRHTTALFRFSSDR